MLDGLTAFVTGASGGIGRMIAIELAGEGANVAIAARSDGIFETADRIESPDHALPVRTDVTDDDSVRQAIQETVDTFGGVDCLVNNVGIAGPTAPIEEVSIEEWEHTMDVNVTGMVRTTQHALPYLRESHQASVVNLGSITGKRPLEHRTPYTASKMAVIGLSRTLAFELGDDDITVNVVCPGATKGDRVDRVIQNQADARGVSFEEAKHQVFTADAALGVLVEPEDIARLITYLASDHGRHITAQDINVDAGTIWY